MGAEALQISGVGGKVEAGAPGKDMVDERCLSLAAVGGAGAAPRLAPKLAGAPSKEARPPLVADETQHRIDARPSWHGPHNGRGALYASTEGGSQLSAFCIIGILANAAALRHPPSHSGNRGSNP
jgi:hypothetical protein